jgi:uncharacterized protein YbjT (DUF2867 family)
MKIVVIGGTGLIGSKVVRQLRQRGHEPLAASPDSGVNTLTGEGLRQALTGAAVVVDTSNSPSFDDSAVMTFFETSTRNLLAAEAEAGVRHHVALSVVGTDRLTESGYFRAKIAQEKLIKASAIPYSIVHATQFYEFVKSIADAATEGGVVRLAPVLIQPIAADDVAAAVTGVALGAPVNGVIDVAGPEQMRLDALIERGLRARNDARKVIADPRALLRRRARRAHPDPGRRCATRHHRLRGLARAAGCAVAEPARRNEDDGCQLAEEAVTGPALSIRSCTA